LSYASLRRTPLHKSNNECVCAAILFPAGVLMKRSKPEKFMKGVYFVATAAMVVPMAMSVNPTKDPSE
jgi:hypothetical protein